MTQSFIPRWILGHKPNVEVALRRLEQTLFAWSERWEQGPLPGSYIMLSYSLGNVTVGDLKMAHLIPCELRPIALQAGLPTGGCTIDIESPLGTSILTTPLVLASQIGSVRKRGDFATDKLDAGTVVALNIDAASGGAKDLVVDLWCKHPSKVEDV